MGTLNKILNGFIKFAFILLGLAIAVVPIIYIFGHQAVSRQSWSASLERFSGRTGQLQLAGSQPISNIYLRAEKGKLSWGDVNATLELANYLQHQLEKNDVTVVRRLVEFKKPTVAKKLKKGQVAEAIELVQSNILKETPPLQWLKEIVEPYLSFQHQTLKRKHWIIVCLGELDAKVADEIESLHKANNLYRFIVVSPWPITSKFIDVAAIPYEGTPEIVPAAEESAPQPQEKQAEVKVKEGKGKEKKDKKYKVKQVKSESDAEGTPNNSSQPQEL